MIVDLFPSQVYVNRVVQHDMIKGLTLDYVEKEYEKDPSTFVDKWDSNVFTTYGKNDNFPWDKIIPRYKQTFDEIKELYGIEGMAHVREAWFNGYKEDQYQEIHDHIPNQFSCIHLLSYDETEHLPPIFLSPFRQVSVTNSPEFISKDPKDKPPTWAYQSSVSAKEGDIIIFPSYLEHKVPRQSSSKLRVTISFNLNFVNYENFRSQLSPRF